ncbi:MAG: glycoside hydrolase family 88 protein [Paludibacter sp.]|nr:glycoside hydrolase family 88 protein [Paludibacter sp.]
MSIKSNFILSVLLVFSFSIFAETIPYSQRMTNSQMSRSGSLSSWDYPDGLFVESILKVYAKYGGSTYYNYALNYAKATVNSTTGKIGSGYSFTAYTLDNVNPGMFLLDVYNRDGSSQFKIALDTLYKQLQKQPRTTDGGYWHKQTYPNQMWLDGLYMGTRYYAAYEKQFDNGLKYDDIVNQFVLIHSKTYDPEFQLNYHAWSATPTDANSFWANENDPFKGCSKEFWARGLGWYAAALVDVLEILPENYAKRQELLDILNQVAAGIKRWQDPVSGCWYQLLRYDSSMTSNGTPNYIEASASSMYTYALLKAIRLNLISNADYLPTATKAYQGLLDNFISQDSNGNLSLNRICRSAGLGPASNTSRDGTINYYLNGSDAGSIVSNDLKGVGPFIMASVEYETLNNSTATITLKKNSNSQYNVVSNKNNVRIQSPVNNISDVSIYNSNGIEINHWQGRDYSEVLIPLSNFRQGLYFFRINGYVLKRIINI